MRRDLNGGEMLGMKVEGGAGESCWRGERWSQRVGPVTLCRVTFHSMSTPMYNPRYSLQPGQLARPTVKVISWENIKAHFALYLHAQIPLYSGTKNRTNSSVTANKGY